MRVVSGNLGGRTFDAPHGHRTHPMSDKVRGALFNALGDIEGLSVLDAFAGTGAISIEAISRGAASAVAIDVDKAANTTIVNNIKQLGINGAIKAIRANSAAWSKHNENSTFDIVVLDPPYGDVQPGALEQLAMHAAVGGLIVLSLPPTAGFSLPPETYELLSSKTYGDAVLAFYRRIQ